MKIELCLIDCSSIQRYVFGSNELKSVIGASFNVAIIFKDWIKITLNGLGLKDEQFDLDSWRTEVNVLHIKNEKIFVEAGYIGGGNALLIFKGGNKITANKFLQEWSKKILFNFPGIVTAAHVSKEIDISDQENSIPGNAINSLFVELAKNKSSNIPNTIIARHGITGSCSSTGLSMESLYIDEEKKPKTISSSLKSKYNNSKDANKTLEEKFKDLLKNQYTFPFELDRLGQFESENHIAIVHIDGNSMGKAFQDCADLAARRELSRQVDDATNKALENTLKILVRNYPVLIEKRVIKKIERIEDKKIKLLLPIRPIILNGDDVTFICNAKLAFWIAEVFMKIFEKQTLSINNEEAKLSSCAGISIIKTKYPFYRGYELAEELCSKAKEKGRANGESWLDFHIAYSGLSGSLETIRKKQYKISSDNLLWRPWKVGQDGNYSFESLKNAIKTLRYHDKKSWPRSKIKKLAQVLVEEKEATIQFLRTEKSKSHCLPDFFVISDNDIKENINDTGWYEKQTPYFDIIEVMDFYPECLLKETLEGK